MGVSPSSCHVPCLSRWQASFQGRRQKQQPCRAGLVQQLVAFNSSQTKLLVLDFDGTLTDAEQEGVPYWKGYLSDLSILVGKSYEEVDGLAQRFQSELNASSSSSGWNVDGRIVAPTAVDPYLRIRPVAHAILDHLGAFSNPVERTRLLEILFKYNYEKTSTVFHEGARSVLESLEGTNTFVVTNSYTEHVRKKLTVLGAGGGDNGANALNWLDSRIRGLAKKYILADDLPDVPESLHLPGLDRPVYLRRRKYHDVLEALMKDVGCTWQDVVVIGDIFELDLALPYAMGARVGLMANQFSPVYEQEFLKQSERGAVLTDVTQIPEFAFGFSVDQTCAAQSWA